MPGCPLISPKDIFMDQITIEELRENASKALLKPTLSERIKGFMRQRRIKKLRALIEQQHQYLDSLPLIAKRQERDAQARYNLALDEIHATAAVERHTAKLFIARYTAELGMLEDAE